MGVSLGELESALNGLLRPEAFQDYCPNGLQVEGRAEVQLVVTGVTASQALLEAAVDAGADALLVHHGWFWKGDAQVLTGMRRRRTAYALQHDLNLFAYHLPLDAHPELGNNAALARQLGFAVTGGLQPGVPLGDSIGMVGSCEPRSGADLATHIGSCLARPPLHVAGRAESVRTVAWCTGGAQGYIEQAVEAGVDAYITGEVSEQTVHIARENGLHFYAAGHHATERYGVQAVGAWLAREFGVSTRFIDIDNPA